MRFLCLHCEYWCGTSSQSKSPFARSVSGSSFRIPSHGTFCPVFLLVTMAVTCVFEIRLSLPKSKPPSLAALSVALQTDEVTNHNKPSVLLIETPFTTTAGPHWKIGSNTSPLWHLNPSMRTFFAGVSARFVAERSTFVEVWDSWMHLFQGASRTDTLCRINCAPGWPSLLSLQTQFSLVTARSPQPYFLLRHGSFSLDSRHIFKRKDHSIPQHLSSPLRLLPVSSKCSGI